MTEESVEFLYGIGRSDLIAGVSVYAVRPSGVKKNHPVISAFTHANIKKILELKPDLVIGFSDIQKEMARDLIGEGLNVFISNQRSLSEILTYLNTLGHMIGESEKTTVYIDMLSQKMEEARQTAAGLKFNPRVYIEEWDGPRICGIRWFSEVVELCGGIDIFAERSKKGSMAKDRFVQDEEILAGRPDVVLASWCGKKFEQASFESRAGYSEMPAVQAKQVFELPSDIFLQPGPAIILDGIDLLSKRFSELQKQ